jgi:hypothetical protein
MKRAILASALFAALTGPALAHPVGFRNPAADLQPSEPASVVALVATQAYDAFNSAHRFREGGREMDPTYRPFSHGGAPTMLLGFAAVDGAVLLAAHAFRVKRDAAERALAAQSAIGILYTNTGGRF